MSKPVITISPDGHGAPLPAGEALSSLRPGASHHEERDRRHPLGIYNLSVSRICRKVIKCSDRLEEFWKTPDLTILSKKGHEEIIDYLELSMYSAAEHVDDIEEIAKSFYKSDRLSSQAADVRKLKKNTKALRDEITSIINTVKHAHGRFRIYETDFTHGGRTVRIVGFFIEGWKDGGAAPHPVLHSGEKTIISITSILWKILTFLGEMSSALAEFLARIDAFDTENKNPYDTARLREAAISLARLPLYALDEDHPFSKVRWNISLDDALREQVDSGIYGSILTPWSKTGSGSFSNSSLQYEGDGTTAQFKIVDPNKLNIHHWT
ncbi:hypothetical protein LCM28_05640 [Salipiger pacificus]|nr:hypothetical protein [Alloyangia pacifica]